MAISAFGAPFGGIVEKQLGSIGSLLNDLTVPQKLNQTPELGSLSSLYTGAPQKMTGFNPFVQMNASSFFAPQKQMPDFGQNSPSPAFAQQARPGTTGSLGSLGGQYSVLDQYDQLFQQAADQAGIPSYNGISGADWLKAIAAEERGWEGTSIAGAQGIMQVMPSWGQQFGLNLQDPAQNILAGAKVLADGLKTYGDMPTAIRSYLGFGTDAYGTTDQTYLNNVTNFANQLGSSSSQSSATNTGTALTSMFGPSANVQSWGSFGVPSGNGLYGYGTQYGMDGVSHTGEDVVVPYGTQMFAPFSGHVICAGTGIGTDESGGTCQAFNYDPNFGGAGPTGNGSGRIEIMSNDGKTVLIFGHASSAAVQPGQIVNAGTLLGLSGGENSAHVHLEARVKDPTTPSGWRIVDPATVLGGGFASSPSTTGASPTSRWQNTEQMFQYFLNGGTW